MIGERPTKLDPLRERFSLNVETRKAHRLSFRPGGFRLEPHVELAHGPEDRLFWCELSFSQALVAHHENRVFAHQLTEAFLRLLHGGAGLDVNALLSGPETEKPLSEGWLRSRTLKNTLSLVVAGPDVTLCSGCAHPCLSAAPRCPACGGVPRPSWWKRFGKFS